MPTNGVCTRLTSCVNGRYMIIYIICVDRQGTPTVTETTSLQSAKQEVPMSVATHTKKPVPTLI
jgi:hypothetical protein